MISRLLQSKFDQCDDSCGWVAAFIAALAYGTFGLPIKETVSVDVHPLVLQSYKTITMFLFSWFVVLMGESVRYTPWGILSGLLWVSGGTGGIYAIRSAGMAVAVGTWSSVMILVNFVVGIMFFKEPVASFWSTCGAFVCLAIGLVGMSIYSAKPASPPPEDTGDPLIGGGQGNSSDDGKEQEMADIVSSSDRSINGESTVRSRSRDQDEVETGYDPLGDPDNKDNAEGIWRVRSKKDELAFFGNKMGLSKRQLGILGAVMNGILTGSSLVPVHYAAKQGFGGAAFMLSFAAGALFANCMVWLLWFLGKMVISNRDSSLTLRLNAKQSYESMPLWYFKELWIPGFSAGILLAIAMFGSIMSVTYLGQGVGNSIIQSKILISGMWGIFWYKEIVGSVTITKWFTSALITVCGIVWLSFERIHARQVAYGLK